MKRSILLRILVQVLAALVGLTQIACASGGRHNDDENTVYMTEAPYLPADAAGRLADGKYRVLIYSDLSTDSTGCVWATVGLLKYDELSDSVISQVREGDTVQLHYYAFQVQTMEKSENNGVPVIYFNDGTETCVYVGETNTWRFIWPSDVPYTYEDERYTMPIAVDATLTDELTPTAEGESVYGVRTDSNDPSIGVLDSLEDFFSHYRGLESEYAVITVRGGEITDVLIEYHP